MENFILAPLAFATSIISGLTGMGGGTLLLSFMTFILPFNSIVPIHGLVQLFSNSSRCFYLRSSIRWSFVGYFALGMPIGFTISYFILNSLTETPYYYLLLSVFLIYAVFKPKWIPELRLEKYQWTVLGVIAVIQGSFIGVIGPLISPFFLRSDLEKEEVIATKATVQMLVHFLKLPLFISLHFDYKLWSLPIAIMVISALLGSYFSVKILLGKISNQHFRSLYKLALLVAALRLFYKFVIGVMS